jgi:hypothetical protein
MLSKISHVSIQTGPQDGRKEEQQPFTFIVNVLGLSIRTGKQQCFLVPFSLLFFESQSKIAGATEACTVNVLEPGQVIGLSEYICGSDGTLPRFMILNIFYAHVLGLRWCFVNAL